MAVYLGLDCGGSSCRALAVDEQNHVVHTGQSGPANILSTPRVRLRQNLRRATEGCPPVSVVCGCFAGLITNADRTLAQGILSDLFPDARIRCEPDYAAALLACPEGTDVCVVSGTGSVLCSEHEGVLAKSGGRGYLLGNAGSAFYYGREAIRHFLETGPDEASEAMRNEVERRVGSLAENEVVATVHRTSSPAALLARFANPLGRDAMAGLPYAIEAVERGSRLLASQTATHVLRYAPSANPVRIALAGGLWSGPAIFRGIFESAVCEALAPRTVIVSRITMPPVQGAVRLAMETNP